MSSSGPNSPGTLADDAGVGTVTWSNPSNASASDNSRASEVAPSATSNSHYLKATNFGFSVSGTIDGVVVEIERSCSAGAGNTVQDSVVKLVVGGSVVGTNKADTVTNWPATGSEAYKTYGSSSDLWGATIADTDVNASNFGVVISAHNQVVSPKSITQAQIDHIRITVYYTAGGAAGQPTSKRFGGVPFMGAHGSGLQAPVRQWIRRASGLLTPQTTTRIWRPANGVN